MKKKKRVKRSRGGVGRKSLRESRILDVKREIDAKTRELLEIKAHIEESLAAYRVEAEALAKDAQAQDALDEKEELESDRKLARDSRRLENNTIEPEDTFVLEMTPHSTSDSRKSASVDATVKMNQKDLLSSDDDQTSDDDESQSQGSDRDSEAESARKVLETNDKAFALFLSHCEAEVSDILGEEFDESREYCGRGIRASNGVVGTGLRMEREFDISRHFDYIKRRVQGIEDGVVFAITSHDVADGKMVASYVDVSQKYNRGIAVVWDLGEPARVLHVLTALSTVSQVAFSPKKSSVIIGALVSGKVCCWNTEVKPNPTSYSTSVSYGHALPPPAMALEREGHTNRAATVSVEGRFNIWNVSKSGAIRHLKTFYNHQIQFTSITPREGHHFSEFYTGDASGNVYKAIVLQEASAELFIRSLHKNRITKIQEISFPSQERSVVVTSSIDGHMYLVDTGSKNILLDIAQDYSPVLDFGVSPVNPFVIAYGTMNGKLRIWNLAMNLDSPVISKNFLEEHETGDDRTKPIVSIKWSEDGKRIYVTSTDPVIREFRISSEFLSIGRFKKFLALLSGDETSSRKV